VFTSGYTDASLAQDLRMDDSGVLEKPYTTESLAREIAHAMNRGTPRAD
jgi:hypothetical protein